MLWPFCKLHPSCSKRPSGVLIGLGSDAAHRLIFTIREFHVKKEILPSSATSYHYCPRTFGSSMIQEAKKYNLLISLFSILHCREDN